MRDPEQSTGGVTHTEPPWGLRSVRLSQDGSCPPLGVGRDTWILLERLTWLHMSEKSLPPIWGISQRWRPWVLPDLYDRT